MTNKIRNRFNNICGGLFILYTTCSIQVKAQDSSYTRPPVTDKWEDYHEQVKKNGNKKMVELKTMVPGIVYDLRYAGKNNFMHRLMYPLGTQNTFMRLPPAIALAKVQAELKTQGLGLKIFDAYRPYSVTVKFWELVKDDRYVANPSKGSGHNRGIAVDLTIINLATGKELNMGTGFDNFSDTAHHDFTKLVPDILQNRQKLRTVMEKFGFITYNEEWWHYYWPDAPLYEILDLDFKKLEKDL